jgi:hypothetical protein
MLKDVNTFTALSSVIGEHLTEHIGSLAVCEHF